MVHEDAGGSNVKVLCFCGSTLWVIIGGFWFMVVKKSLAYVMWVLRFWSVGNCKIGENMDRG